LSYQLRILPRAAPRGFSIGAMALIRPGEGQRPPWVPIAAAAAAGGAALLAVALVRRRSRGGVVRGPASAEREQLMKILQELSKRFFRVCQDVASISRTVRAKIEASNVDITDDKLREQLSRQCKVFERLEAIQAEVSEQFGLTPEAVRAMQQRAGKDPEVNSYAEGFKTMLSDALGGALPVLPNVTVPEGLTEEKVLAIQAEVQQLEVKRVLDAVGGSKCTIKQLGEVLSQAHKDAWEQTLESHAALVKGGPEVYHSVLAIYMRNEDFAKERRKLDEAHQQKMVKLFHPEQAAASGT